MDDSRSFSADDSFRLINEMIADAKHSYEKNSFYFLLWGWLLFFTGIAVYIIHGYRPDMAGIPWFAQGIIGGIISMVYSIVQGIKVKENILVKSPVNKTIIAIWLGFGITLFSILFASGVLKVNPNALVLMLTAFPTYLCGRVLRFKPLVFGGICFWVLGIACLFVPYPYDALVFSIAILIGYLAPGYLLRRQEKKY